MKELELVVYEKVPGRHGGEPRYNSPDGLWAYPVSHVDGYAKDKRLTDAELAAEYQNSRLISYVRHHRTKNYPGDMVLFDHYERGLEQEWTLERFATLPHYDEQETMQ